MNLALLKSMHHLIREITEQPFFIAGGAVRDTLYGVVPKDYDCVLPLGGQYGEGDALYLMEDLSNKFRHEGLTTLIYQAYGKSSESEGLELSSFQKMFYSCMKVEMGRCQLDILLSKNGYMSEHVQEHDCNMNMVWFNGDRICWEHGGTQPIVSDLVFRDGIDESRQSRMWRKFDLLNEMRVG